MTAPPHRYRVLLTREAVKDVARLTPKLREKLRQILEEVLAVHPHVGKKLFGDLAVDRSYRLTFHDRIVYRIDARARIVYIKRARTHYGD